MIKAQIKIGSTYQCRVSGVLAPVLIASESGYGGWHGKNLYTNRPVRIRSARRLICEMTRLHGVWRPLHKIGIANIYRAIAGAHRKRRDKGASGRITACLMALDSHRLTRGEFILASSGTEEQSAQTWDYLVEHFPALTSGAELVG